MDNLPIMDNTHEFILSPKCHHSEVPLYSYTQTDNYVQAYIIVPLTYRDNYNYTCTGV